jgi:hypothetical protein
MTIAAGVVCSDGILICADTQHTEGNVKFDRPKIWGVKDYLLMTGSGASNYMKMAFDKLADRFKTRCPKDTRTARNEVEKLVQKIHREHIFPLYKAQHPVAPQISVDLIVAIRCEDGDLALIATNLTTAWKVDLYETTGSGRDVFIYWAGRFLAVPQDIELTGYLAKFLLRECKDVSSYVGGHSYLATMVKARENSKIYRVEAYEGYTLAWFANSVVALLLNAINRNTSESEYEKLLNFFMHELKELRTEANSNQISFTGAKGGFKEIELIGGEASSHASASEPEPPPEQSDSYVRGKGVRRGRRRP